MAALKESYPVFGNSPFLNIFRAFRMAIHPSKLLIALSAILLIWLVGWLMDFSGTVVTQPQGQISGLVTELHLYMQEPESLDDFMEAYAETGQQSGVFETVRPLLISNFHEALASLFRFDLPSVAANIGDMVACVIWAFKYHPIYSVIFGLITLAIIACSGGAISRIASLELARSEKPSVSEAMRFGFGNFRSLFAAPLVPLAIILVAALFIIVVGLIGNLWYVGEIVIGLLSPLVLLCGAGIAIFLIGTIAGGILFFPAVAYDGADCFDAMSRAFSYIYTRPWRMLFYVAVATVYGAICYVFVRFFTYLLLLASFWFMRIGVWADTEEGLNKLEALWSDPEFMNLFGAGAVYPEGLTMSVGAFLIYLFVGLAAVMVAAFLLSFSLSANTIIYALLRNRVDNTPIEEIYISPEASEATETEQSETGTEPAGEKPEENSQTEVTTKEPEQDESVQGQPEEGSEQSEIEKLDQEDEEKSE